MADDVLYTTGPHAAQQVVRVEPPEGDSGNVPGGLDLVAIRDAHAHHRNVAVTGEEAEALALELLRNGTRPERCPDCNSLVARCFFCTERATRWVASDGLGGRTLHLCDTHADPFLEAEGNGREERANGGEPAWAPEVAYYTPGDDGCACDPAA